MGKLGDLLEEWFFISIGFALFGGSIGWFFSNLIDKNYVVMVLSVFTFIGGIWLLVWSIRKYPERKKKVKK